MQNRFFIPGKNSLAKSRSEINILQCINLFQYTFQVKHGKIKEETPCRCINFILFFFVSGFFAIIKDSLMHSMFCPLLRTNGLHLLTQVVTLELCVKRSLLLYMCYVYNSLDVIALRRLCNCSQELQYTFQKDLQLCS